MSHIPPVIPMTPANSNSGYRVQVDINSNLDALPGIDKSLQQVSEGLDETNRHLTGHQETFADFRTALATLLLRQEREQELVRARYSDDQYFRHQRQQQNMEEAAIVRYGRQNHWAEELTTMRNTNTHLQQTQEATTRQAAAVVRVVESTTRQAADIARAANTFERVANSLDCVANPVGSLFGNLAAVVRWLWNWGPPLFMVAVFAAALIAVKHNEQSAAGMSVIVDSNTTSRIEDILASNPWWKDLLKDPRPVFGGMGDGAGK
ncbi:hypothetical protein N431DRAFT_534582 [Stipitochalara longipes BDJ]|nr:hypothetical protein N431DRAFT_534582 [Stipitochalara longipes BDJ]